MYNDDAPHDTHVRQRIKSRNNDQIVQNDAKVRHHRQRFNMLLALFICLLLLTLVTYSIRRTDDHYTNLEETWRIHRPGLAKREAFEDWEASFTDAFTAGPSDCQAFNSRYDLISLATTMF